MNNRFNHENLRIVDFKPPRGILSGVMKKGAAGEQGFDGRGSLRGDDIDRPVHYGVEWGGDFDNPTGTIPPLPLLNTRPRYPQALRNSGVEGLVLAEVGIGENGTVLYAKILESPYREFSLAVIEWLKEMKFKPAADRDRQPFRCKIRLPIRFKIED